MPSDKPDCYECKFRGSIPGDCHSNCNHPALKAAKNDPLAQAMAIFASAGRTPPQQAVSEECKVTGNPRGVRSGWFYHPWNFDPVWLESCTGFEKKDAE
jgi:hypothetical protein